MMILMEDDFPVYGQDRPVLNLKTHILRSSADLFLPAFITDFFLDLQCTKRII
jgi:hypothetical protein